jgi:ABC-type transport system involved in multi-copper enzyme maturation permease subunit
MVGPVLHQELLLGSRRGRHLIFRRVFTGWLVLEFLVYYWIYLIESQAIGRLFFANVPFEYAAAGAFATRLLGLLLSQQLLLVLLATPALSAGAVTDEKASGTLQYLLAADLTSGEILIGKFLGRLAQVFLLALCGLPVIAFVGAFAGLSPWLVLLLFGITLVPAFGLGAASLLASVWSRHTRDAVLTVYCVGIGAFLALQQFGGLEYFNPLMALEAVSEGEQPLQLGPRFLVLLFSWGCVGVVCLALATWRLRPAYVRQLQSHGLGKKRRWILGRRAPVSDEPIRWKERFVEGIAPLAVLRRVPRWLGMVLIFSATLVSSALILWIDLRPSVTLDDLWDAIRHLQILTVWNAFPNAADGFLLQGAIASLLATLVIGIRCSGAVTGERERQTWEALLLSPLPVPQLIRAKLWGIIGASYPYLTAYAVPALVLGFLGGIGAFLWTVALLVGAWLAMCFVGATGLACSVRAKGSWRSLLGTLFISYVGGCILFVLSFPLILILYGSIMATLFLFDSAYQTNLAKPFASTGYGFILGCYGALLGIFAFMRWWLLRDAEQYIADRERIRHWAEEPRGKGRARRRVPVAQVP